MIFRAYVRGLQALAPPPPPPPRTVVGGWVADAVIVEVAPLAAGALTRAVLQRPQLLAMAAIGGAAIGAWRLWQVPGFRDFVVKVMK